GGIARQPAHVIDILPTCLDAAGVEYPAAYEGRAITPVEGKSLLPVLRGGSRPVHDAIGWEHEGNRALRQGRWKLVARRGKAWELYDIDADRSELNDLAASQPERVRAMAALWEAWAKRAGVVPWESLQAAAKKKKA
ncbi:MAG: arylsulfatase, partial [Planctomycetes bacterium]|nr:arylsulfatase [Planctomycetota bacterium]